MWYVDNIISEFFANYSNLTNLKSVFATYNSFIWCCFGCEGYPRQGTGGIFLMAKDIQIPKKIKITYADVILDFVDASFIKANTDCYGQYLQRENKIELQKELLKEDNVDNLINTLLHEVCHAAIYYSGLNAPGGPLDNESNEELVTNNLTNIWHTILKDNKWLITLLAKKI